MENNGKLVRDGEEIMSKVQETIIKLTENNPLILFTLNEDKDPIIGTELLDIDDLMNLPYCHYYGSEHYYTMGTVQKVHGKDITIVVQDDYVFENSNFETLNIRNFTFDQQIEILKLLKERL